MSVERRIQRIIAEGEWLYDGITPSPVRVIEQDYDFWYEIGKADGDLEAWEKPELNEKGLLYYVTFKQCENIERPWWVESQGFKSIQLAKQFAEAKVQGEIKWKS